MKKFVVLSLIAPVALGLSACGSTTNNSAEAVTNTDDANLSMGVEDGNMTDNVVDANATTANTAM